MKLAWNAIVKNEYAIIERCVESSIAPYRLRHCSRYGVY